MAYKLVKNPIGEIKIIVRLSDNACIPMNEANTDYQEYLKWVAEGNQPKSADE